MQSLCPNLQRSRCPGRKTSGTAAGAGEWAHVVGEPTVPGIWTGIVEPRDSGELDRSPRKFGSGERAKRVTTVRAVTKRTVSLGGGLGQGAGFLCGLRGEEEPFVRGIRPVPADTLCRSSWCRQNTWGRRLKLQRGTKVDVSKTVAAEQLRVLMSPAREAR